MTSWLHGVGWAQAVLDLNSFLNKPKIWCNVKMRKTQGKPWIQQQLKAENKNEFKTCVFSNMQRKRNQNIYFLTTVHSGVIISTDKNMQIPLHSDENNVLTSLKSSPFKCQNEKNKCLKRYISDIFSILSA